MYMVHLLYFVEPINRRFIYILYCHFKSQILNMVKAKRDINQQNWKIVDLHFIKSELFSLTWSHGSRQRDMTSSEWKFQLQNLAVKVLGLLFKSSG